MRKRVLFVILWFGCGYFASAMWTAEFYGKFGRSGIETKGSAARSSLFFFLGGPISAFWEICDGEYPPMWNWPKYLLDDYKKPPDAN